MLAPRRGDPQRQGGGVRLQARRHLRARGARCPPHPARGTARGAGGAQRPREGACRLALSPEPMKLLGLWLVIAVAACGQKATEQAPQFRVESHSIVIFAPESPQLARLTSVPIEPRREL